MWTEQSVFCCVFFGTKGARSGSQFYCRSGSDKMIWILWNNYLLYNPTVLSTENAIGQVKPKVFKKVWIFQNNYCTSSAIQFLGYLDFRGFHGQQSRSKSSSYMEFLVLKKKTTVWFFLSLQLCDLDLGPEFIIAKI